METHIDIKTNALFRIVILFCFSFLFACQSTEANKAENHTDKVNENLIDTRTGYVKTQGAELFYQDTGNGPAVILVHGSAGNSQSWEQQVPALVAAGYRVVRFDIRSYGLSSYQPGMAAAGSLSEDIENIRQALNLEKIFVVGQALGGEGALEYGLDYPDYTLGIVSASSYRAAEGEPAFVNLRDKLAPISQIRKTSGIKMRLTENYIAANPEGVKRFIEIDETNKQRAQMMKIDVKEKVSVQQLRNSVQSTRLPIDYERLKQMSVPVLVLSGDLDQITSPQLMEELAINIPGAQHKTIENAGRYAFWEAPLAYNKTLIEFLDSNIEN